MRVERVKDYIRKNLVYIRSHLVETLRFISYFVSCHWREPPLSMVNTNELQHAITKHASKECCLLEEFAIGM